MNETMTPRASPATIRTGAAAWVGSRRCVGFAIALLLAACAGPVPTSGSEAGETHSEARQQLPASNPGTVLENGGDVSTTSAGPLNVAVFASQSGVICDIAAGETDERPGHAVECFVPDPIYQGWEMTDEGVIEVSCPAGLKLDLVVDSEYWLGCEDSTTMSGPTLEPGTVTRAGGFTCTVQTDSIDCTYGDDSLGFRVSSQSFASWVN